MLKAGAGNKETALIGRGLGRQGVVLHRFFPGLYSRLVRRRKFPNE